MKRIAIIADLQVGSKFAVVPEEYYQTAELDDRLFMHPTPIQQVLLNQFNKCADIYNSPDVLVVMGEGVEGIREPRNIWSSNPTDQIDACNKLIKKFNAKRVEFLKASDWHVNCGGVFLDETLSRAYYSVKEDKPPIHFHNDLHLKIEGCYFHFSHHISVSKTTWQYRTTPLAREEILALLNMGCFYDYNAIFRAHAHYYCTAGFAHHAGYICPCFSWRTPFGIKDSPFYGINIGALQVTVDGDDYIIEGDMIDSPRPKLTVIR